MLIKAVGAIMLLSGSLALGLFKAWGLSEREKILYALEEAIMTFESEIRYCIAPMYEAMSAASNRDISGLFKKAAEYLKLFDAASAMRRAVNESTLAEEEKSALLSFASGLSAHDAEGQIKNALLCRERIKKISELASEKKNRLYKLYCISGGVCGAAALLIII